MKNSFILYTEFYDIIKDLTNEQIGKLHRAIYLYELEGCIDTVSELDPETKIAFKFIRLQLDKNKSKWEETKEKRAEAGKKGNEKRWGVSQKSQMREKEKQEIAKIANATFATNDIANEKQEKSVIAKIAVNVNDNVNVNEDVNVINKKDISSEQQVATEPETTPDEEEMIEAVIVPEELKGLNLYENNEKLLKLWPELITAWKSAFPGINIIAEVKAAHAWEVANPKRRKVDKARFLQNWMARAQDSHGGKIIGGKNKSTEYDFGGE